MRPANPERRQHERHTVDNSVSISSFGIFQVTDISRGGFCFRCPPYTPVTDSWETDILASGVSLSSFPAKRVWVSVSENGTHEYLPTIVGAKFGRLTKKQNLRLQELLDALQQSGSPPH